MKTNVRLLILLLTSVFLFTACRSLPATSSGRGPHAEVRNTHGQAELNRNGQWRSLNPGAKVRQGDTLRTGTASHIDLFFGKYGGILRLTPDTQLQILHFGWTNAPGGKTMLVLLDLQEGRITGDTLNPAPNTTFRVRTAGGTYELK